MGTRARGVTLRSVAVVAFLPSAFFSISTGTIAPVIPLSAVSMGASPATAAMVVAALSIGKLLADPPAGALTARFGDRATAIGAGILSGTALITALMAPTLAVFAAAMLVMGMGTAVWRLARQTLVTEIVPMHLRGRAMSTLSGVQRLGNFIGPFMGAAAAHVTGTRGAFWLGLGAVLVAMTVLALVSEPPTTGSTSTTSTRTSYSQIVKSERGTLGTLGIGMMLVGIVQSSRQVVLPLWGQHIGLDAAGVSLIYGICGAMDLLLFYPAGRLMDVRGRVVIAVISMLGLAGAHFLLPLTNSVVTLTAVAVVMGLSNGIGAGLGLTLGADVAPPGYRAQFFGMWRGITDFGSSGCPMLLSGITATTSLALGVLSIGGVGLLATAAMAYWIPRRATPRDGPGAVHKAT